MEAVPKLPLISFELKVSPENTHFGPKLKQYIAEAYREDPESYSNEIHQLEGLRSAAVRPSMDSAGLSALVRYFCQLRALQSRFPMSKGQPVACSFSWKDLYANMSCSLADIRFEMACILYNIGALLTQLAASEPRTSADSLKAACTKFQNAAWAFLFLREQYTQPSGVDVSSEIMRLLQEICFAQAQECILDKSIQDTKKPSVVGAVAVQVLFFYKNSLALLGPSTGTDNIHEIIGTKLYNYWHRFLSFKVAYIGSIVNLYQGMNAEEQQKMGERVAYYQLAADKLGEARKLAKYVEPVQITQEALTFTNDVVEGKKKAAKNENEFIYHEEVPDKDLLMDLKPVCLVKAIAINLNDPEISGPDIFSRLVPMVAHEAASMYSEEKAKLLRHVVTQVEAKNMELTEFMSSLQLDQLDVLEADQKIPQEIVDRCAAMNAKTEVIQLLVDSMNNLAEIITDVEHSLAEIKALIQEETQLEKDYQKTMGPRPPSIVQTELSREAHKYQEAHARTSESNQVLHKAMTLHIANLRLLAQPLDVLQAKIPSIQHIEGLDRETMAEMRRVVGKAREMQTQRDSLIQQLRESVTADDITSKLLARSNEPANEIFKQELEKHTPTVKIIEQNLAAQENIINRLTSLYASYGDSRRLLSDVLRKRDGVINALITSYDTYEELLGKSQKGQEFYKKLSHNVCALLARLRSTCQVQREERAQMLHTQPAAAPVTSTAPKAQISVDTVPAPSGGGTRKLKDYLPYMKNRSAARSVTPQAQVDAMPADSFYPDNIYPTSVRPPPVGSEATDVSQMKLPDGVAMPPNMHNPNPYHRYSSPFAPNEPEPYSVPSNYAYSASSKSSFDKSDDMNYGYSTYTPPQFSSVVGDPNTYSNPYYSGTSNNSTIVSDSPIPNPYSGSVQANSTPSTSQYNPYNDQYAAQQLQTVPEVTPSVSAYSQNDMNVNFAQMQISYPKSEPSIPGQPYGADYSQTFYSVQYPHSASPSMSTYSHAPQNSLTSVTPSQIPSVYSASNYPYAEPQASQSIQPTNLAVQPPSTAYSNPDYSYATSVYANMSQAYPVYTNTESTVTSTSSVANVPVSAPQQYNYPEQDRNFANSPALPLDAYDQPIKSHVTGQALSSNIAYQPSYHAYDQTVPNYTNPADQKYQVTSQSPAPNYSDPANQNYQAANQLPTSNYTNPVEQNYQATNQIPVSSYTNSADQNYQVTNQSAVPNFTNPSNPSYQTSNGYTYPNEATVNNANMSQRFQNHPGYTFNPATGSYEYTYGSQINYITGQPNVEQQKDQTWGSQYTSAGSYATVQSPSENLPNPGEASNQTYYITPYGYTTTQSNEPAPISVPESTNYGANVNQSTYMQAGQGTSITYINNQVSSPKEEIEQPNFNQTPGTNVSTAAEAVNYQTVPTNTVPSQTVPQKDQEEVQQPEKTIPKEQPEPSVFDLLSEIDFTVEQKPLMPHIKVPQISESAIKKPAMVPKLEPVSIPVPKEEVIERPAKVDLFTDPMLLNKFTQEVKKLHRVVDSFATMEALDAKWKALQDEQVQNTINKSKSVALRNYGGHNPKDVVPFDDSRLTLKSDPDAYINASFYKQLAPWCIPLVISNTPTEDKYGIFWKVALENKISCVVCLLSEIEMQGKSYWPTAKGQCLEFPGEVKVTLEDVKCTVHWTERKLTLAHGKTAAHVSHYQINVFPAKIVCSPLVLLADKILQQTYEGRLSNQLTGAWIADYSGAGRCGALALLLMLVGQVRAGQIGLCDMLEAGCLNLYKHRTNVLEDKKYLADAYTCALFYVQGVLCSGTAMFNGEAVSVPPASAALPPAPAPGAPAPGAPAPAPGAPTPGAPAPGAPTTAPAPASAVPNAPSSQKALYKQKFSKESFEEMKQAPGLTSGDMKDPLNFLDPLWSLKKK